MNDTSKNILVIALTFVLVVVGSAVGSKLSSLSSGESEGLGGSSFYEEFPIHFGGGLYAGENKQVAFNEAGDLTTTGDVSISGTTDTDEFTQGGGVLAFTATSTQAARTLTAAELEANNIIEIRTSNSPALTLTLPASSTMTTLLPNAGDFRMWWIDNQQAAATTTTIAAGAGIDLIAVTTADDVIDGLETASLFCWRKGVNTDVMCVVSELLKAD